jgi:hypothetical protein
MCLMKNCKEFKAELEQNTADYKRKLGRRVAFDARDFNYPARRLLKATKRVVNEKFWRPGPTLDQGETPQCVAYSSVQLLRVGPVFNRHHPEPEDWYKQCLEVDEWPGNDPNNGTSVRAAMKVGQALGYYPAYAWADAIDTLADWIIQKGPAQFGTIWTNSMFSWDKNGFVNPNLNAPNFNADDEGGHAYLCIGVSRKNKYFLYQNSWGQEWGIKKWGQGGLFKMTFDNADKLFRLWGEIAMPTEVALK